MPRRLGMGKPSPSLSTSRTSNGGTRRANTPTSPSKARLVLSSEKPVHPVSPSSRTRKVTGANADPSTSTSTCSPAPRTSSLGNLPSLGSLNGASASIQSVSSPVHSLSQLGARFKKKQTYDGEEQEGQRRNSPDSSKAKVVNTSDSATEGRLSRRTRVSQACKQCRNRKARCLEGRPQGANNPADPGQNCKRCTALSQVCQWEFFSEAGRQASTAAKKEKQMQHLFQDEDSTADHNEVESADAGRSALRNLNRPDDCKRERSSSADDSPEVVKKRRKSQSRSKKLRTLESTAHAAEDAFSSESLSQASQSGPLQTALRKALDEASSQEHPQPLTMEMDEPSRLQPVRGKKKAIPAPRRIISDGLERAMRGQASGKAATHDNSSLDHAPVVPVDNLTTTTTTIGEMLPPAGSQLSIFLDLSSSQNDSSSSGGLRRPSRSSMPSSSQPRTRIRSTSSFLGSRSNRLAQREASRDTIALSTALPLSQEGGGYNYSYEELPLNLTQQSDDERRQEEIWGLIAPSTSDASQIQPQSQSQSQSQGPPQSQPRSERQGRRSKTSRRRDGKGATYDLSALTLNTGDLDGQGDRTEYADTSMLPASQTSDWSIDFADVDAGRINGNGESANGAVSQPSQPGTFLLENSQSQSQSRGTMIIDSSSSQSD